MQVKRKILLENIISTDVRVRGPQFDADEFQNLVKSIQIHGILHDPLCGPFTENGVVSEEKVKLCDGLQRKLAAEKAGLTEITVNYDKDMTDANLMLLQSILNSHRIKPKLSDEIRQVQRYCALKENANKTQDEIAEAFCVTDKMRIQRLMKMTNLAEKAFYLVEAQKIPAVKAFYLATLPKEAQEDSEVLENAMNMPTQDFNHWIASKRKEFMQAAREGRKEKDLLVLIVRKRLEIITIFDAAKDKLEKANPDDANYSSLAAEYKVLQWVLSVDPETVAAKKSKKDDAKRERDVERAKEKKAESDKVLKEYEEAKALSG